MVTTLQAFLGANGIRIDNDQKAPFNRTGFIAVHLFGCYFYLPDTLRGCPESDYFTNDDAYAYEFLTKLRKLD
jgi:hypothetical protein